MEVKRGKYFWEYVLTLDGREVTALEEYAKSRKLSELEAIKQLITEEIQW